jgi:hypothetical protein
MHLHRGAVCVMQSTITAVTAHTLAQKGRNDGNDGKNKQVQVDVSRVDMHI